MSTKELYSLRKRQLLIVNLLLLSVCPVLAISLYFGYEYVILMMMWIALAAVTLKRKANSIKEEFILFPSLKPLMDYERNHSKNKRAFGAKPLDFAITFSAQILLLSHKGAAGDLGGLKEFLVIDLGLICLINFTLLYRLIKDKPRKNKREISPLSSEAKKK